MPGLKDNMGIRDKIHIILTGPDGKVKQEIKKELGRITENGDVYTEDGEFIRNIKDIQEDKDAKKK